MSLFLCLAMPNVPVRQATYRNDTNILSIIIFEETSLLGQFLPSHENSILDWLYNFLKLFLSLKYDF